MPSIGDIGAGFKKILTARPKISHSSLIKTALLVVILMMAFAVRLLPMQWGYYLSEFDPYQQYRQTKYIVEHGLLGKNGWIAWHDYLSWYPDGNEISTHHYPGLPIAAASLYFLLKTFGVPLIASPTMDPLLSDPVYILCVIFPAIMATLSCLVIFYLGKDLSGESVGLFAALFLALDASYIGRTSLGWFDDETVGIFSLLLFFLLFLRSIDKNKSSRISLLYTISAGLSLGFLFSAWGASRYPIEMTAVFALLLLLIRRDSARLLFSYSIICALAFSIASMVPILGTHFLLESEILPVYGVFFLLCIAEINRRVKTPRKKMVGFLAIISLFAGFFVFLWSRGMIGSLEGKFLAVLNPFLRFGNPLVESVSEHRPSAWGTFYYNWGVGIFFVPVGLFFATMMATDISLFMVIFGLTSIFFASSMIRLTIIMSPVISLLWALSTVKLLKPFILFLREAPQAPGRKMRLRGIIGKETAAVIVILMFILLTLTYVTGTDFIAGPRAQGPRIYTQAYAPVTIAASSMNAKPTTISRDWINTLIWMRENLSPSPQKPGQPGTVVASWWDYGYWITTIANRTSLADNGTWNLTQIQQIGLMFMSNETEAVKILKKYDVTHVLVFVTFVVQQSQGYSYPSLAGAGGDEGKWEWMAKIPELNSTSFGNYTLGYDWTDLNQDGQVGNDEVFANSKGQNTTLYRLMNYGTQMSVYGDSNIYLEYFEEAYFSQKHGQPQAAPGTSYIPLVAVYKVDYPPEN